MEAVEEGAVSLAEAVKLGAVSLDFYCHYFFPKAFRQESAPAHKDVDKLLMSRDRYVAVEMFRGSAKTTKLRAYLSNRIAYGVSRTILLVGLSEDAAVKSLDWLRRAVLFNPTWTGAFHLEKGNPWSATELCIRHKGFGHEVRILAIGIHGSTRGINIDDYRPDLIVVDDVLDEENSATPDARQKMKDLLGGLRHSLAPETDCPEAKFVFLQTPFDEDDAIEVAMRDPQFKSLRVACFTEDGESAWPARWSTETLKADKEAHIRRKQLSLWLREMEVTVTAPESSAFDVDWLKHWIILPQNITYFAGIDPTPPAQEGRLKKVGSDLDDAVILTLGLSRGEVFLANYVISKSPNPEEFINSIFMEYLRWRPKVVSLETVLFQRVLQYYLTKEMRARNTFIRLNPVEDKRKKRDRILQSISGRASNRTISVHESQTEFIEQFARYPSVKHDDLLDAFAIALMGVTPFFESDDALEGEYLVEKDDRRLDWRAAP